MGLLAVSASVLAVLIVHGVPVLAEGKLMTGTTNKQAYVSLMYGDDFLLGLRVLGQSLRESQTTRDLVAVVVGSHVSDPSKKLLRADGWIVHEVDAVQNPGLWTGTTSGSYPPRFWAVYTKLLVFNLTQYETVVYLDADTIALRNLDSLFLCDGLCGVMRHSERLNSGVMVVQPQARLFNDMMASIEQTPSYTGGDQGFLNAYFPGFAASPLFDPTRGRLLSESGDHLPSGNASRGTAGGVRMGRLPTEFNADLGLYVLNSNRWMVPEEELYVLHFTLSSFKPWDWWSSWIISGNMDRWQALRRRLPGTDSGPSPLLTSTLAAGPWLLLALVMRRPASLSLCLRTPTFRRGAPGVSGPLVLDRASFIPWLSLLAALGSLCLAVGFAVCVVPSQVDPTWGWMLAYEWTAVSFALLFGAYLCAVYQWGTSLRHASMSFAACEGEGRVHLASSSGHPWQQTTVAFAVTLGMLGILPWWSDVLGLTSFTGRLFSMGAAIAPTALVIGQLLSSLVGAWLHAGLSMATPPSPKLKHPV